jgi:hypothetical protein
MRGPITTSAMPIVDSTNVPLSGPTAYRYADLVGVERDLRWTVQATALLADRAKRHENDLMFLEALHDTALIRYARCFKKGLRKAFRIPRNWIDELPPALRQAHQDAIHLRDKHIAHSVNDWEINTPVAQIVRVKEYSSAAVRSVSVSRQRVIMMGTPALQVLHELAQALADRVAAVGSQIQAELLKELQGVSPRELERRAPPFAQPGRRKIGNDRKR